MGGTANAARLTASTACHFVPFFIYSIPFSVSLGSRDCGDVTEKYCSLEPRHDGLCCSSRVTAELEYACECPPFAPAKLSPTRAPLRCAPRKQEQRLCQSETPTS